MKLSETMQFLCLSVLQGSAEPLFRWGWKKNVPKIIQIGKRLLKL